MIYNICEDWVENLSFNKEQEAHVIIDFKYCPKCKKENDNGALLCISCGFPMKDDNSQTVVFRPYDGVGEENAASKMSKTSKSIVSKVFLISLSFLSFIMSAVFYTKGYDKMTNYYNSDYSSWSKNAYVGGDAYNYIINGTYSTSFFVLSVGFMLAGLLLIIIYYLSKSKNEVR